MTLRGLSKASFTHMKLILTGKIAFFRKSEMIYVHVPNLREFKVDDYAKKYLKDEKYGVTFLNCKNIILQTKMECKLKHRSYQKSKIANFSSM